MGSGSISVRMGEKVLEGTRILVIEDEEHSAAIAGEMLNELGCVVAGTVSSIDGASAMIAGNGCSFDCAMLDVRLGGEISSEIATLLLQREMPFIVCSGYGIRLPGTQIPVLDKPYTVETLGRALESAISNGRKETVTENGLPLSF